MMLIFNRKWILAHVVYLCSISFCYANNVSDWWQNKSWHPVFSIGGGFAISSDVGSSSKNFPIQNVLTDSYYNYYANHSTKTNGIADIFLGAEWTVRPRWLLQTGVGYTVGTSHANGSLVQGVDTSSQDTYSYNYNISSRQLLVEAKLLYLMKEFYHPYLFAGLGAAFNKAYGYSTSIPAFLTLTRMYASNTTTSFSYAVGAGIDYDLTPVVRVGVGYRFTDLGKARLGQAMIDTTSVSGILSQSHFYNNELLAQVTIKIT